MASRHSPTSKIPKWNTPPPSPRLQAFASNGSKKSSSATSSPRQISFKSKPATSITSGSKIPTRPSATTQNEQPTHCSLATTAEQEARVDVVQFGTSQVGGGEGDTPAIMVDPSKTKDTPSLGITDQYDEEDLDNALVGLIKPFSDRDFSKFLHISVTSEETLETLKPPDVLADYVSSTNSMENVRLPRESASSTSERKSTPMDLWLGADNSDEMMPPKMLEKLHDRAEDLVNILVNEAAVKATISQHGDCSDEMKTKVSYKEKEEAPIKERNEEEDLSSQFDDLVTKLGAPSKSETQLMKQMDLEDVQAQIQQVKKSDSRLRQYKLFLESSSDIEPKKSTSKPAVVPTTKTSSSYTIQSIAETEPNDLELQLGKQTQEKLSRHDQLDDHHVQTAQQNDAHDQDGSSTEEQEEQIVREVDVNLPKLIVQEEVCEYTEESQSDMDALGFGTTDTDFGNESEDGGDTDGEDMIIKLDQLNCNDALIGKKARTIFSVDLSMSKIQVKHGEGENGDGHHNEEWSATTLRKSTSTFEDQCLPSLEEPKDDRRVSVVTREKISSPASCNSIHSLYSRKYNSGQRILKISADQVDKQLVEEDEESTSSDEREVLWSEEPIATSLDWREFTMDQRHKKWLEQGARGNAGTACWNSSSRLARIEAQLANVSGQIKEIKDQIVYYRTVTSAIVFACALLVVAPSVIPALDEMFEKEKEPEPTWWESLFGSSGKSG